MISWNVVIIPKLNSDNNEADLFRFLVGVDPQGIDWGALLLQEASHVSAALPPRTPEGHRVFATAPSSEGRRKVAIIVNAALAGSIVRVGDPA